MNTVDTVKFLPMAYGWAVRPHSSRCISAVCDPTTPFGRPVDPDVYLQQVSKETSLFTSKIIVDYNRTWTQQSFVGEGERWDLDSAERYAHDAPSIGVIVGCGFCITTAVATAVVQIVKVKWGVVGRTPRPVRLDYHDHHLRRWEGEDIGQQMLRSIQHKRPSQGRIDGDGDGAGAPAPVAVIPERGI
jgi:hypothetical protein